MQSVCMFFRDGKRRHHSLKSMKKPTWSSSFLLLYSSTSLTGYSRKIPERKSRFYIRIGLTLHTAILLKVQRPQSRHRSHHACCKKILQYYIFFFLGDSDSVKFFCVKLSLSLFQAPTLRNKAGCFFIHFLPLPYKKIQYTNNKI